MIKAWMRDLQVVFTSNLTKSKLIFGDKWLKGEDDVDIEIVGTKYLSCNKDNFTIRISNLTYKEIIQLIKYQYYDIEIKAGYRLDNYTSGAKTIFKGSVIFITNELTDNKTHTAIILAGSKMMATYGQKRMNLSLKSGINMYSAINFICKRAGITNPNIDEDLKNRLLRETTSTNMTINNFFEVFNNTNGLIANADSSYKNTFSIINPYRTNNRVIKLDNNKIVLVAGYPKLTSDGLTMTILPTFNFMPMDVIVIDNSIIDISVSSNTPSNFNNSMFLDEDGKYLITQIDYNLQNRSSSYSIRITAKARSLYSKNLLKGQ